MPKKILLGFMVEFKNKFAESGVDMKETATELTKNKKALEELINSISNSGSGSSTFSDDYSISKLYHYLDSITITQELSLLNICLFILLLVIVINIVYVFFGNEIIRVLQLEKRWPRLSALIRLRTMYQRYYIMVYSSLLILICIFGIFINLLTFLHGV